jgi:2-oxoglutarate ferredoxin oxidoreductase subunit delta
MSLFRSRQSSTKFVRLNKKNCTACWSCVEVCHKKALGRIDIFGHRHAHIVHPELCTGCLKCEEACTFGALTAINPGVVVLLGLLVSLAFRVR